MYCWGGYFYLHCVCYIPGAVGMLYYLIKIVGPKKFAQKFWEKWAGELIQYIIRDTCKRQAILLPMIFYTFWNYLVNITEIINTEN